MHIGFDRKTRRRQNALGGLHIPAVEAETFGQLQPTLDAAFASDVAIMILDAVSPFPPGIKIAKPRDYHRVFDRNGISISASPVGPGPQLKAGDNKLTVKAASGPANVVLTAITLGN